MIQEKTVNFGLLKYFTHTSLLIGLAAPSFIISFLILLHLPLDWGLLAIVFLMAFPSYNINKITDSVEDKISLPERSAFVQENKRAIVIISIVAYFVGFGMALAHGLGIAVLYLMPPIFVIVYSINAKFLGIRRWKEITLFKNISVSLLWAFLMTFYPVVWFNTEINIKYAIIFAFVFLKFIGNTIVFDIRDMKGDSMHGIKTLPQMLGVEKTILGLHILNAVAFLTIIIPAALGIFDATAYFISLVCVYSAFYISKIGKMEMKFVADILSDGEYIVMAFFAFARLMVFG